MGFLFKFIKFQSILKDYSLTLAVNKIRNIISLKFQGKKQWWTWKISTNDSYKL